MALEADLVGDPPQCGRRPLGEVEIGDEWTPVVVSAGIIGVDRAELDHRCPGGGHGLRLLGDRHRGMVVGDGDRPGTVGRPVGRDPWWPVDRPDLCSGVGGGGGGVERGVLDVVAHRPDVVGSHRLDVHQGAAVVEVELAVVVVGHGVAEVHELGRGADVDLHPLEDGLDRVPLEPEGPLHPGRVDGAGPHPLLDGDVAHPVASEGADQVGHAGPVDEVAGQQELGDQPGQLLPVEAVQSGSGGHDGTRSMVTLAAYDRAGHVSRRFAGQVSISDLRRHIDRDGPCRHPAVGTSRNTPFTHRVDEPNWCAPLVR